MGPLVGPIVICGLFSALSSGCGGSEAAVPDGASGLPDAGAAPPVTPDAGVDRPDGPAPYPRPSYTRLSETGLFADPATRTLTPQLVAFVPNHVLWSDGA